MLKLIIVVAVIGFGLGAGVSGIVEAIDDGDPSDDQSQAASQLQLPDVAGTFQTGCDQVVGYTRPVKFKTSDIFGGSCVRISLPVQRLIARLIESLLR